MMHLLLLATVCLLQTARLTDACAAQKCDCGSEVGKARSEFSEMVTDGITANEIKALKLENVDLEKELKALQDEIQELRICTACKPATPSPLGDPEDCYGWWLRGHVTDGVYSIKPPHFTSSMNVWCDMRHEGWIVWQRRFDGSVNFTQNWRAHKYGFGNLNGGEFWLGNEVLHNIVKHTQGHWDLRIDVTHSAKTQDPRKRRFSVFDEFKIFGENRTYTMGIKSFKYGDGGGMLLCGDKWGNTTMQNFTTYDADHDNENELTNTGCSAWKCNCARLHHSGWWHNSCFATNLNFMPFGEYSFQYRGGTKPGSCQHYYYYLSQSEMKIRKSKPYLKPS